MVSVSTGVVSPIAFETGAAPSVFIATVDDSSDASHVFSSSSEKPKSVGKIGRTDK
jgi:hypothetical protein